MPLQTLLLPRTPFSLPLLTKGPGPSSVQLLTLQILPVLSHPCPHRPHTQRSSFMAGPVLLAWDTSPTSCLLGTRP